MSPLRSYPSMRHRKRLVEKMENSLVSVILPVHNASRYLQQSIESILEQTYDNFEIIAIDDGSTDTSLTILQALTAADSRLKVYHQENIGITATLNRAVQQASGKYIARMDADDISLPHRFKAQVEYLNANPEIVAVGGKVLMIDDDDLPISDSPTALEHEAIDQENMLGRTSINHPAVMMRATAIKQLGGYNPAYRFGQDLDLWLRLAELGRLANLDSRVLLYRLHPQSAGVSKRAIQVDCIKRAIRAAVERRGLDSAHEELRLGDAPASLAHSYRNWGWWALRAGNLHTAKKYARLALLKTPLNTDSWRLYYCVQRGY